MSEPQYTQVARELIETALEERTRALRDEVRKVTEEMAARGMFASGFTITRVKRLAEAEVAIRAEIVLQQLIKVVTTIGVESTPALADELKKELRHYLPEGLPDLEAVVLDVTRRIKGVQTHEPSLEEARERALRKTSAEIDLLVAGLRQRAAGATSITIHGPVGAVQTGPGSAANVVQNIQHDDRERLLRALQDIAKEVASRPDIEGHSREDILVLVQDAQAEVERDRPNLLKLKGSAIALASAIQTAAALQPAYQLLKAALVPFGVVLPW